MLLKLPTLKTKPYWGCWQDDLQQLPNKMTKQAKMNSRWVTTRTKRVITTKHKTSQAFYTLTTLSNTVLLMSRNSISTPMLLGNICLSLLSLTIMESMLYFWRPWNREKYLRNNQYVRRDWCGGKSLSKTLFMNVVVVNLENLSWWYWKKPNKKHASIPICYSEWSTFNYST